MSILEALDMNLSEFPWKDKYQINEFNPFQESSDLY